MWWVYGIALSADSSKIVGIGDAVTGGITIISTEDLSTLYSEQFTSTATLRAVTSNSVDKWYAVGNSGNNLMVVEITQDTYALSFKLFSHSNPSGTFQGYTVVWDGS